MTECREDIFRFDEKKAKPKMASVIWNDMANNNVKKPLKNQN